MTSNLHWRLSSYLTNSHPLESEFKRGFDDEKNTFDVPPTMSVYDLLTSPLLWSGPNAIVILSLLFNVVAAFYIATSAATAVAVFAFFRLSYNIGFGIALHYQSNYRSCTKFIAWNFQRRRESILVKAMLWVIHGRMTNLKNFSAANYPDCFNAWLLFRFMVDIVLCNDGLSYLIVVVKCWTFPERLGLLEITQYLFGILLAAFNYWAKVDAHRIIGDYSWYWGDTFFILDQNLTFDGVFALVPHPMYTAGYAIYYGFALLSRSYTVLIVSLVAHMLQIGFLVFVENPHIDRTYGENGNPSESADPILYDPVQGLFPRKSDALLLLRLDLFRPNDLALVVFTGYILLVSYLLPSDSACVVHAFGWLVVHWISIGTILRRQSKNDFWNEHFLSRGYSLHTAFSHWKALYNFSRTSYLVAFTSCALRLCWFPHFLSQVSTGWIACITGGLALLFTTAYSTISSYQVLGDFGTFYGDFFIPTEFYKPQTRYMGIYRFLNNPECVTGYAGLHGLALISQSWTVFWLALTAQALNFIFIKVVEVPHMEKIYSGMMRKHTPAGALFRNMVRDQLSDQLVAEAHRIEERAMQEILLIYKRLADLQLLKRESNTSAWISCPESIPLNTPLKCLWRTSGPHPDSDWIGIYNADVDSAPGLSRGRWMFVPNTEDCSGEIEFPIEKMPDCAGVYEIRYHSNYYNIVAKHVFIISSGLRPVNESTT